MPYELSRARARVLLFEATRIRGSIYTIAQGGPMAAGSGIHDAVRAIYVI